MEFGGRIVERAVIPRATSPSAADSPTATTEASDGQSGHPSVIEDRNEQGGLMISAGKRNLMLSFRNAVRRDALSDPCRFATESVVRSVVQKNPEREDVN
jgi:hypothetical protein